MFRDKKRKEMPTSKTAKQAPLRFRYLVLAAALATYLLIVIGGIVRVTGSGLGCPDWPTCYGSWIPPLRADALIEYSHRLVAALTTPLILAAAYVAWRRLRGQRLIAPPLLWVFGPFQPGPRCGLRFSSKREVSPTFGPPEPVLRPFRGPQGLKFSLIS